MIFKGLYKIKIYDFSRIPQPVQTLLLTNQDKINNLYWGPYIDACYQVWLGEIFLEINQPEIRIAYGGNVC